MVAQLLEFAVGEPAPIAVGAADQPAIPHPRFIGIREHYQLLGFVDYRQRGVQYAVPQTEDRGIGSDAESQRKDGDGGEGGPCSQNAQRVPQILKYHVTMLL